ncbi:MAG: sigma-70 family RNA polymerase sigma factor [Bacteroidales bacterium]|nr:sigma-70 family RNA polymerase sigma factor [Bacteroidales bacterium]
MNPDDRLIIDAVLQGRTEAYGKLVLQYQDRLYNAILRVVDHRDDAADVVQEAFINAYQSLASFKGDSGFYTWLYRIAFNSAISLKRRKWSFVSLDAFHRDGNEGSLEPADSSLDSQPGSALERSEEEFALQRALHRLSPEHRTVLVLNDIEGMKYEEIAKIVNVPVGTIRSRIHRARLELRELLMRDRNEEAGEPAAKTLKPLSSRPTQAGE